MTGTGYPLLYLEFRGGVTTCEEGLRLVSRVGHIWKEFSPGRVFFKQDESTAIEFEKQTDHLHRVRCDYHSHVRRKALKRGYSCPGFCQWYNTTTSRMKFSLQFERHCGIPLGVVATTDFQMLPQTHKDRLRPVLAEAFSGSGTLAQPVSVHDVIERQALFYRYGKLYSSENHCLTSCCIECCDCSQTDRIDLLWLLRDLLPAHKSRQRKLQRVPEDDANVLRVLNYGCGTLESTDPLTAVIFKQKSWRVRGLCVDADENKAKEVVEILREAGVPGMDVKHMALSPDLSELDELLEQSPAVRNSPVDILKVDIDSFDLEVTVTTLQALLMRGGADSLPVALIIEYSDAWPPPFEIISHYWRPITGRRSASSLGRPAITSLSAAVTHLWPFGYRLHRIAFMDLIFVREVVARKERIFGFAAQDEWACYMEKIGIGGPWVAKEDLNIALQEIHADIQSHMPYPQIVTGPALQASASSGTSPMTLGFYGLEVAIAAPLGTLNVSTK